MTIKQAIDEADRLRRTNDDRAEKILWLSRLEHQVWTEAFASCENPPVEEFKGFTADTPEDTVLMMKEPYSEAYVRYLEAQIDLMNGEMKRYNSSIGAFNEIYAAFKRWVIRTYKPKQAANIRYF